MLSTFIAAFSFICPPFVERPIQMQVEEARQKVAKATGSTALPFKILVCTAHPYVCTVHVIMLFLGSPECAL